MNGLLRKIDVPQESRQCSTGNLGRIKHVDCRAGDYQPGVVVMTRCDLRA
jgi:hypothetical protein